MVKVMLGKFPYPTKSSLRKSIKRYLRNSKTGPVTNEEVIYKLEKLLEKHPCYDVISSKKIVGFSIDKNTTGRGKGFAVVYEDGERRKFSYHTCIDQKKETHRRKVLEAFRMTLRDQIIDYRRKIRLPVYCSISGRLILKYEDINIDHVIPFSMIIDEFMCDCAYEDIGVEKSGEVWTLRDKELAETFEKFHMDRAILQVSHRIENSSFSPSILISFIVPCFISNLVFKFLCLFSIFFLFSLSIFICSLLAFIPSFKFSTSILRLARVKSLFIISLVRSSTWSSEKDRDFDFSSSSNLVSESLRLYESIASNIFFLSSSYFLIIGVSVISVTFSSVFIIISFLYLFLL